MIKHLQELFKQEKIFASRLFLLNIIVITISIYPMLMDTVRIRSAYDICKFFIACTEISIGLVFLYAVIAAVLPNSLRSIFKGIIYGFSSAMFIIELFSMYKFQTVMSPNIMLVILDTNSKEASEFISSYILTGESIGIIALLVFFLGSAIFLGKYFSKMIETINFKIALFAILIGLGLNSYIWIRGNDVFYGVISFCGYYNNYKNVAAYINEINEYEKYLNTSISKKLRATGPDNIVLIIGESTSRNYMGIYGYHLNTTPRLLEEERAGHLTAFKDAISSYSGTVQSVMNTITFKNNDGIDKWSNKANIVDVMKNAGYRTSWISNQEKNGMYAKSITFIANRADKTIFNETNSRFDEELLSYVTDEANNSGKKFTVIHLMGAHVSYKERYPIMYEKFNYKDISKNLDIGKKQIVAEYCNAVNYNDYIVNEIIKRYKDKTAIVIYISDHGQDVYDSREYYTGSIAMGKENRYAFEIPFIIYSTPRYMQKYPEKYDAIKSAVYNPYMTDDIIHTIVDIAEIEGLEEFDPAKSIINKKFNANRVRMANSRVDYDKSLKWKK